MTRATPALLLLTLAIGWSPICAAQDKQRVEGAPPTVVADAIDTVEKAILQKLQQTVSLEFKNATLDEVAAEIGKRGNVNVVLDRKALRDDGINPDLRITRSVSDASLERALRLVLNEHKLAWEIQSGVVVITAREVADTRLVLRMYDVASLMDETDAEGLIDAIATTAATSTWQEAGGPGSIGVLRNLLLIENTREVHEQVVQLLRELWEVRKQQADTVDARLQSRPLPSPAEKAIRQALLRPLDLDFDDWAMDSVLAHIGEQLKISVQRDKRALIDAGIDTNVLVTFKQNGIPAGAALKWMFNDLDLVGVIENDALVITTRESAATSFPTRLYPIADLQRSVRYRELTETIATCVEPSTWQDAGGPGGIKYFEPCQCLLISNTPEIHEQVEELLQRLRHALKDAPAIDPRLDEDGLLTRVYLARPLTPAGQTIPTGDLVKLVKEFVMPNSWQAEEPNVVIHSVPGSYLAGAIVGREGMIRAAGPALVIRHTPKAHREIEKFLKALGALPHESQPESPPVDKPH